VDIRFWQVIRCPSLRLGLVPIVSTFEIGSRDYSGVPEALSADDSANIGRVVSDWRPL
jgi:hypothetical protein